MKVKYNDRDRAFRSGKNSILLQSYPILWHHPHRILPSSYFYLISLSESNSRVITCLTCYLYLTQSLYSISIFLLSYLYLTSILLESYPMLLHRRKLTPIIVFYLHLTSILFASNSRLT